MKIYVRADHLGCEIDGDPHRQDHVQNVKEIIVHKILAFGAGYLALVLPPAPTSSRARIRLAVYPFAHRVLPHGGA